MFKKRLLIMEWLQMLQYIEIIVRTHMPILCSQCVLLKKTENGIVKQEQSISLMKTETKRELKMVILDKEKFPQLIGMTKKLCNIGERIGQEKQINLWN